MSMLYVYVWLGAAVCYAVYYGIKRYKTYKLNARYNQNKLDTGLE